MDKSQRVILPRIGDVRAHREWFRVVASVPNVIIKHLQRGSSAIHRHEMSSAVHSEDLECLPTFRQASELRRVFPLVACFCVL